jgi:hypothetical protein
VNVIFVAFMEKLIVILIVQLSKIGYLQNYGISLPFLISGTFCFLIRNLKSMDIIILFIPVIPSAECAYCAAAAPLPPFTSRNFLYCRWDEGNFLRSCTIGSFLRRAQLHERVSDGMRKYESFNAYPCFFAVPANFVLRSWGSVPRMLPF